ncbi:hypothetical protein Emag_002777 [Eimeria magna]
MTTGEQQERQQQQQQKQSSHDESPRRAAAAFAAAAAAASLPSYWVSRMHTLSLFFLALLLSRLRLLCSRRASFSPPGLPEAPRG